MNYTAFCPVDATLTLATLFTLGRLFLSPSQPESLIAHEGRHDDLDGADPLRNRPAFDGKLQLPDDANQMHDRNQGENGAGEDCECFRVGRLLRTMIVRPANDVINPTALLKIARLRFQALQTFGQIVQPRD